MAGGVELTHPPAEVHPDRGGVQEVTAVAGAQLRRSAQQRVDRRCGASGRMLQHLRRPGEPERVERLDRIGEAGIDLLDGGARLGQHPTAARTAASTSGSLSTWPRSGEYPTRTPASRESAAARNEPVGVGIADQSRGSNRR